MRRPSHRCATGALLFALALALRAAVIALSGFDGLYGQDPFAYLRYAGELGSALASFDAPPPFLWPIGYPLLVALLMPVFGSGALAAQWVSAVAGALVAPLVYALVCALRPQAGRGALVAGLLAATAPQLMISSVSVMSDAPALAWITLSAWALVRYQRVVREEGAASAAMSQRAGWAFALAAFAFAMAVLTRWAYVIAAPAWVGSTLFAWSEAGLTRRRRILASVIAGGIVLVVVGSQFAGDWGRGELSHSGDLRVGGWNPLDAFRSTLTSSDGMFRYAAPVGVFYAQPLVHPSFIFPLLTVFVCVGAVELARGARAASTLIIGWPLIMYGYLAGRAWENPRFSLGLFPPLLVLLGVGFEGVIASAPPRWRKLAIACAAIGLLGSLAWNVRTVGRFAALKDSQLGVVRWVEHATPERATIVSLGLTNMVEHYTARAALSLYHLDTDALAALRTATPPAYLLIDPDNVEDQWRGRRPALNFEWLRNHSTLAEVGRQPPWMLFKIEPRGR